MRCVLIGAAVLTCLATSPAALRAHPGHDHWQDAPGEEPPDPTHSAAEQAVPGRSPFVLATFLGAAVVLAVLAKKHPQRSAVLIPPAVAAAVLLASLGCGGEQDQAGGALGDPKTC